MAQTANHHHDEHKRVSFGTEEQVTKIIYDDGYDEYNNVQVTRTTTSFTSPDAPPNKVKVTSEERDIPRPISPPAQFENPTISATSPPLPALIKKMEHHDLDNPFRPQENLYHEVDPIVEAYKNRPFPPSPVGSPIPHDNHASSTTPQHNSSQNAHETSHISYFSTPQKTLTHPGNVRASEKRNSETVHITEVDALLPAADMPPPNKAEVVHLDKKKKCACCSVQ